MKRLLSILMLMIITLTLANTVSRAVDEKISLDKCKISFSKKTFTYTGEGIIPVVKVTYKKKKLKKDKDYNIYYKDNVSVGTATVTLVGLGNYTGSTSATFTITKGKQTIKAKNIKATYGDENVTVNAVADNPMTYKSSNKKVITVNPAGIITIKKVGKATITVKCGGTKNYKPASTKVTIEVSDSLG